MGISIPLLAIAAIFTGIPGRHRRLHRARRDRGRVEPELTAGGVTRPRRPTRPSAAPVSSASPRTTNTANSKRPGSTSAGSSIVTATGRLPQPLPSSTASSPVAVGQRVAVLPPARRAQGELAAAPDQGAAAANRPGIKGLRPRRRRRRWPPSSRCQQPAALEGPRPGARLGDRAAREPGPRGAATRPRRPRTCGGRRGCGSARGRPWAA